MDDEEIINLCQKIRACTNKIEQKIRGKKILKEEENKQVNIEDYFNKKYPYCYLGYETKGLVASKIVICPKCNSRRLEIRFYEHNLNFYHCMDCNYEFDIDKYVEKWIDETS